jgi:hypothetical protein
MAGFITDVLLGFTKALCSESDDGGGGGGNLNVLMLMLYWSEKMIRYPMYLPPNTRLIHKTNNRLTLTTVFCFVLSWRVEPPSLLWRHMKLKNRNYFNCLVFIVFSLKIIYFVQISSLVTRIQREQPTCKVGYFYPSATGYRASPQSVWPRTGCQSW